LTPLNTGLLLTFESGRHSLYDYKNDKILWETANKNKTGQPPAYDAATGTIYTTDSEKNLYIISEKTGRNEILTALPEKGSNPPYFYKERIYIGIESGKFIAIDSSDGDIDWEFETINNTVSQAVGYENMICFSALNNQIYCLNRRTGTIEFRIPGKNRFYLPPVITDDILFGFPFNEGVISFNLDEEKPIGLTKLTDQILTPVKVSQSKTLLFILNNSGILKTYNYSQIVTLSNTID
jgi:outer membrane protein assembly factor BamB